MSNQAMAAPAKTVRIRRPETEINRYLALSVLGTIGCAVGIGYWLQTANIVAATVAQGTLVVESDIKKVQHQTGGTIGEIFVREGDRVKAGDVLMRLKDTVVRSNAQLVRKQLDEQYVRQSRLEAERDARADMAFPAEMAGRESEPAITAIFAGERSLFESRRNSRAGQRAQMRERAAQLRDEISGYTAQQDATRRQFYLIQDELTGVQDLFAKNLVNISRLNTLQREVARLEGELGRLVATAAQARGKIAEIELQILQLDTDLRNEVVKDLRDVQSKVAELSERRITAEDILDHIDIRSPETGKVHQLSVHTVGGVINPGEQVMQIVPAKDQLLVEIKLPATEIDTIHIGQPASIKLTAFNARTTPQIDGSVSRISADLIKDQPNGPGNYVVRIAISASELDRLADQKLLPGMPAEIHIRGVERTALSYFLKPMMDQMGRIFRER